jgi:hypothetical protein
MIRSSSQNTDAITLSYKETLKKLRQRIRTACPNQNMKDVLLLHDNAQPHISLRTCKAIGKTGWAVLPRPAHIAHLAPSDYNLFGPAKGALRGRHFADDNEMKQRWLSSGF